MNSNNSSETKAVTVSLDFNNLEESKRKAVEELAKKSGESTCSTVFVMSKGKVGRQKDMKNEMPDWSNVVDDFSKFHQDETISKPSFVVIMFLESTVNFFLSK